MMMTTTHISAQETRLNTQVSEELDTIYRGEPCPRCKAEWLVPAQPRRNGRFAVRNGQRQLTHAEDCTLHADLDRLDKLGF